MHTPFTRQEALVLNQSHFPMMDTWVDRRQFQASSMQLCDIQTFAVLLRAGRIAEYMQWSVKNNLKKKGEIFIGQTDRCTSAHPPTSCPDRKTILGRSRIQYASLRKSLRVRLHYAR
jgi:hypothetical protein